MTDTEQDAWLLALDEDAVDTAGTAQVMMARWRAGEDASELFHRVCRELASYHKSQSHYDSFYFKAKVREELRAEVYERDLGAILFLLVQLDESFPIPPLAERDRVFARYFGDHAVTIIRREEAALREVLQDLVSLGLQPPAFFDRATLKVIGPPDRS